MDKICLNLLISISVYYSSFYKVSTYFLPIYLLIYSKIFNFLFSNVKYIFLKELKSFIISYKQFNS